MEYDDDKQLAHYLLVYGGKHFNDTESSAAKAIWARRAAVYKLKHSPERKAAKLEIVEELECLPGVSELLSEDKLDFSKHVGRRFMREQPDVIARCPKCEKVLRTPRAKQCMWCFHDWHET